MHNKPWAKRGVGIRKFGRLDTPTISIVSLGSKFEPRLNRCPTGFSPGKNLFAKFSSITATIGDAAVSLRLMPRPRMMGMPIVLKKSGPIRLRT